MAFPDETHKLDGKKTICIRSGGAIRVKKVILWSFKCTYAYGFRNALKALVS